MLQLKVFLSKLIIILDRKQEENEKLIKKKISKSNKLSFADIYTTKKFKYIVTQGNNSKLIREAMK